MSITHRNGTMTPKKKSEYETRLSLVAGEDESCYTQMFSSLNCFLQNPGWGDPSETIMKAQMFYASVDFLQTIPVLGAVDAMQALTGLGFRLAIVTTRSVELHEQTTAWINRWMPGQILPSSVMYTRRPNR